MNSAVFARVFPLVRGAPSSRDAPFLRVMAHWNSTKRSARMQAVSKTTLCNIDEELFNLKTLTMRMRDCFQRGCFRVIPIYCSGNLSIQDGDGSVIN